MLVKNEQFLCSQELLDLVNMKQVLIIILFYLKWDFLTSNITDTGALGRPCVGTFGSGPVTQSPITGECLQEKQSGAGSSAGHSSSLLFRKAAQRADTKMS